MSLNFEHIKKVYDRSTEISPVRTPRNEKSVNTLIDVDFSHYHPEAFLIDEDLKKDVESLSTVHLSKEHYNELELSKVLIKERNQLGDCVLYLKDKIAENNGKILRLEDEKSEYEKIISMLTNYEKYLNNI